MRPLQLLALGLLSAGTVVASRCKPSAPSSSSSAAAAASSSAAPRPPPCSDLVQNSEFRNGLADWHPSINSPAGAVGDSNAGDCAPYATCAAASIFGPGGGQVTLSQHLTTLTPGALYTFAFSWKSTNTPAASSATLQCTFQDAAGDGSSTTVDVQGTTSWNRPEVAFSVPSADMTVTCDVQASDVATVFLWGVDVLVGDCPS